MTPSEVRPPVVMVLPVIDVCDGRCQMCGIWKRTPRTPLSPATLARILADGYLSGSLTHVNVTGGEPCRQCHSPIHRDKLGGRSSHWCPNCQH